MTKSETIDRYIKAIDVMQTRTGMFMMCGCIALAFDLGERTEGPGEIAFEKIDSDPELASLLFFAQARWDKIVRAERESENEGETVH